MPFTVTMPKLSPTMEEGTIAKWHCKEGDSVEPGQVLIEVATDKATVEHSALDAGVLRKIMVQEGQSAVVNQPIAIFTETADESIEGYEPEGQAAKQEEVAPAEAPFEDVAATPAAPATAGGMQQPAFVPEPPVEGFVGIQPPARFGGQILASPLAKKLAKEKGIDLSRVKGSGPRGRIVSSDLDPKTPDALVQVGPSPRPTLPPGSYEEESLSPMRKVVGKRLQESKTFIPHFYVTQEVNAEPMVRLREELKQGGLKVTFNDFVLRATALTLRKHPEFNSGFNTVNSTIVRFQTIDISVAVSLPEGLITPIVRYADHKSIFDLSVEVKQLAKRAKQGKLDREEYAGGSFTISNLGMFGVRDFVAVINPPQAAILAIAGIQEKPVVRNGEIVPGKTISFTLSADHRVVDGADSARFLNTLQVYLENPSLLLA